MNDDFSLSTECTTQVYEYCSDADLDVQQFINDLFKEYQRKLRRGLIWDFNTYVGVMLGQMKMMDSSKLYGED